MKYDPNCDHCNTELSDSLKSVLLETGNFRVVCDMHPLIEGHILIIPKEHISCVGEFSKEMFEEFNSLYKICQEFLLKEYKSFASFEHGIIGQTVFHCHFHLLPFAGKPEQIVPEGKITAVKNLEAIKPAFQKDGKYLFYCIGDNSWLVDIALGVPRFFRDRFAIALGNPVRGDWKKMHNDKMLMDEARVEVDHLMAKWKLANK